MPGDLSVGGKEFQALVARMKKERWQVVVFNFAGRKEIWLPLEDLVVWFRK